MIDNYNEKISSSPRWIMNEKNVDRYVQHTRLKITENGKNKKLIDNQINCCATKKDEEA
jgi:hypothetical protein